MAWVWGDSFDLYAAVADMTAGYWDSGNLSGVTLVSSGRFTGSQAIRISSTNTATLIKSSGSNDAVHHIVCAIQQNATLTGTTAYAAFQLFDGTTAQCSIVFRSDGTILLQSGAPGGTTLATYTGAISAQSAWFAFEFEVVINNTTGSFTVRKNGNTGTADFTATSLNTRGGTTNNYANKLTVSGNSTLNDYYLDDLLWRSDASSVSWVGDIRCYARMPTSDQSVQFSPSAVPAVNTGTSSGAGIATATGTVVFQQFTATYTGGVGSVTINATAAATANYKAALYDNTGAGGMAGALIGSVSNVTANAINGFNTITFSTPPSVVKGQTYWIAVTQDATISWHSNAGTLNTASVSYASFPPSTMPASTNAGVDRSVYGTVSITPTTNYQLVSEAKEDAASSYVFDSTSGHADFYGIGSIPVTPVSTIAVTTRGFAQKSDAGARSGAVQLKSGSSTVTSPSTALATTWGWLWRTDVNDPATSAPWTATAVNNIQCGPIVTA